MPDPPEPSSPVVAGGRLEAPQPASVNRTRRSSNLDALRAIAALMVVGAHASYLNNATRAPAGAYRHYLWSGVELFFILSGYLISRPFVAALLQHRQLPVLKAYAVRRAARILPAYWLVLIAALVLTPGAGTTVGDVVAHVVLLQDSVPGQAYAIISVAWTLGLEAMFYVLVPLAALLILRCCREVTTRRLVLIVVITWALSMAVAYLAQTFGRDLLGVAGSLIVNDAGDGPPAVLTVSLPTTLYLFCPGILIAIADVSGGLAWLWQHSRWSALRLAPVLALLAFSLWSVGILVDWSHSTAITRLLRDALFSVAFCSLVVLALGLPPARSRVIRLVADVGLVSYGVYLWHPLIEQLFRQWNVGVPGTGDTAFLLAFALLLVTALVPSVLSWLLLERPCLRWAAAWCRRLERGQAPRAPAAAPEAVTPSDPSGGAS